MKLKLLILKIILILSFFSNNSFAKNLPPGSGISDVPANVLILLDKSGSMSVRMTSGAGFSYPYSVATDSSGDVYVGQYWVRGIKKFTYSTKSNDTSFASSGTYRGRGNCRSYYLHLCILANCNFDTVIFHYSIDDTYNASRSNNLVSSF